MLNTIEAAFTEPLYEWLKTVGYTHVIQEEMSTGLNDLVEEEIYSYSLVPLKPCDERFKILANKDRIVRITSHDVVDMSNGDPFIRFVVILPLDVFDQYLKDNS